MPNPTLRLVAAMLGETLVVEFRNQHGNIAGKDADFIGRFVKDRIAKADTFRAEPFWQRFHRPQRVGKLCRLFRQSQPSGQVD